MNKAVKVWIAATVFLAGAAVSYWVQVRQPVNTAQDGESQPAGRRREAPSLLPDGRASEGSVNAFTQFKQVGRKLGTNPQEWKAYFAGKQRDIRLADELFRELCKTDPVLAFEIACEIPGANRTEWIGWALSQAFRSYPDEAFRMIERVSHLPISTRPNRFDEILEKPEIYRDRIAALPSDDYRSVLLEQVAAALFKKDPEETKDWVQSLAPGLQRYAWEGIYAAWLSGNPDEMPDLDSSIQGTLRTDIVVKAAERLAEDDPRRALDWIDTQLSGLGREETSRRVFSQWAKQDPAAAAGFFEELEPGKSRSQLGYTLMEVWGRDKSRDAVQWIQELPQEQLPERRQLLVAVAPYWYAQEPGEVLEYINQTLGLPAGFVRNVTLRMAQDDPAAAGEWSSGLPEAYRAEATEALQLRAERLRGQGGP